MCKCEEYNNADFTMSLFGYLIFVIYLGHLKSFVVFMQGRDKFQIIDICSYLIFLVIHILYMNWCTLLNLLAVIIDH